MDLLLLFIYFLLSICFLHQKKDWKDYGKNTDSVGLLWVNMLRYYTETFNWKDNVVTIRQQAPLTRLHKLWNSRCIAIEDPFDLSHNLGAGLSRKSMYVVVICFLSVIKCDCPSDEYAAICLL